MGKRRKRWSVTEKRRIVELTLEPGASVAPVAQAAGVNANQVFQWQRAFHNADLLSGGSTALLSVVVGAEAATVAEIELAPMITQPCLRSISGTAIVRDSYRVAWPCRDLRGATR